MIGDGPFKEPQRKLSFNPAVFDRALEATKAMLAYQSEEIEATFTQIAHVQRTQGIRDSLKNNFTKWLQKRIDSGQYLDPMVEALRYLNQAMRE